MIKKITSSIRLATLSASAFAIAYSQHALAQGPANQNNGAADFTAVAGNVTNSLNTFRTLAALFAAVAGLVLVANSLFNLYKASKDPSHQVKPMSGIIGLVIGGLLSVVGSVMAISSRTVTGNAGITVNAA